MGVDTIAVGTYDELADVAQRFSGDLLVLTPWRPFGAALEVDPALADRVIHTVSRLCDLTDLLAAQPRARFVLELVTSMLRHGLSGRDLWSCAPVLAEHPGPGSRAWRSIFRWPRGPTSPRCSGWSTTSSRPVSTPTPSGSAT